MFQVDLDGPRPEPPRRDETAVFFLEEQSRPFDQPDFDRVASDQQRWLMEGYLCSQDVERFRLGQELHDSTGQLIVALRLDLARLKEVGREYGALAPLYDDDAAFDRDLGLVRLLDADYTGAASMLETCLRLDPRRPSASFLLALARLGQGKIDEARRLLEAVDASDPSYAAARRRLDAMKN